MLSGCLARIIDRARALEQRLETQGAPHPAAIVNELLSTISALSVCFVIAALFASSMLRYSVHLIVSCLFIAAMLTSIVSLFLFLREVYFAIETFEIGLPAETRQESTDCHTHAAQNQN